MYRAFRLASVVLATLIAPAVFAAPIDKTVVHHSTARQAHALLSDAVKYLEANGPEKAFAAFNDRKGAFVKKDLYVFVLDQQGVYRADGSAPNVLVGLNVLETRDAAGNPLYRDMLAAVAKESDAQVRYVWLNRALNKVEPKTSFVHRSGDYVLGVGFYAPRSTKEGALQLLEDAASVVKSQGMSKAVKLFNDTKGKFVRDDLYVFAVDLSSGKFEAHGASPRLTGTNAADLHDVEGHALVNDMINLALKEGSGVVDYVWRNPVTNVIEKKRTFIRRIGNSMIGVGYYRED